MASRRMIAKQLLRPGLRRLGLSDIAAVGLVFVLSASCGDQRLESQRESMAQSMAQEGQEAPIHRVSQEPSLVLGSEGISEGIYFHRIGALFRVADGRIVVSGPNSDGLMVFGEGGRLLMEVGRAGRGPGEFEGVGWARPLAADTVLVWDPLLFRATVMTLEGPVVGISGGRALISGDRLVTGRGSDAVAAIVAATKTGKLIGHPMFSTSVRTRGTPSVRRDTVPLAIYSADGEPIGEIGPLPGDEYFGGGGNSMLLPFGARLLIAAGADRIAIGDGLACQVDIYLDTGEREGTVQYEGRAQGNTSEDIEKYIEWHLGRIVEFGRASVRDALSRIPFRDTVPCYSSLLWSQNGDLWVREYTPPQYASPQDEQIWRIFGNGREYQGQVQLPPGFDLRDAGEGYVLGVVRDSLGVEVVQLHTVS